MALGSAIAVNCNSSYSFSDNTTRKVYTCLQSGTWSPGPSDDSCAPIPQDGYCNLFKINNSTSHFEASYPPQVSENSSVAVTCNSNYVFPDGSNRKVYNCIINGTWSPNTTNISCIPLTTTTRPSTTTSPAGCTLFKLNSTTSSFDEQHSSTISPSSNVTVNCSSGYTFPNNSTQQTFTCLPNSTWSPSPSNCTVRIQTCPLFPLNTTASSFNSSYPDIISPGNIVAVTCKQGYNFPDKSPTRIFTCISNGTWVENPSISYCVPQASCPLFPINTTSSTFQQIYPDEITAGDSVAVACKTGFMFNDLSSVRIYQCLEDGTWISDPSTDVCNSNFIFLISSINNLFSATVTSCPIPIVNLTNAMEPSSSSSVLTTTSDVGTQIFHVCKTSFTFSTGQPINVYQCLGDGTWSGNLDQTPSCVDHS